MKFQLTKREKKILLSLAVFLALGGSSFVIVDPVLRSEAALREQVEEMGTKVADGRKAFLQLQANTARLGAVRDETHALNQKIPSGANIARLVYDLDRGERATGAIVVGLNFSPPAVKGRFTEFAVEVEVEGSYQQQVAYVRFLEGLQRLVLLSKVKVTPLSPPTRIRCIYAMTVYSEGSGEVDVSGYNFRRGAGRPSPFAP
ncbi:MAG: type 4a pilus biogenesis protein PilO [Bacillota bacterium]